MQLDFDESRPPRSVGAVCGPAAADCVHAAAIIDHDPHTERLKG